jgi:hypothetical protein
MSPFIVPLAVFAMVVLIVAITQVSKLRDTEIDVQQKLHLAEMEHRERMRELETELQRIRQGT